MDPTSTLFLRSDELADLVSPTEAVAAVRDAYRQVGEGAPAEPRTRLDNAEPPGFLTGYLAILPETGVMGGYTYAAGFGARDAHFVLPLFDADSGEPLALLDGASLNPFKTGAAGAVGVDALARADATDLAILGSGPQARGQLRATATVRDLDSVRVFSPTRDNREAFAEEMAETVGVPVTAVDSSGAAVDGADIVITATNAREPVFDGDDLAPGTHVTAMGQYHPEHRELDATTVARATYVPDLRARLDRDAGAYIQALAEGTIEEGHVHAELGDVVAGTAPGRQSREEITVFDSGGTGIETVAAAHMLYERAVAEGLGESLQFAPGSQALTGR
jgi:alanine dehydrogenase